MLRHFGASVRWLLALSFFLPALVCAQPAPPQTPPIISRDDCSTWTDSTRLCRQTSGDTDTLWWFNGTDVEQVAQGIITTPTLEQVKTAGRFILSASPAAPLTICNSASCTGVARFDIFISAGNVPSIIAYDAAGNPISQSFGAYDNSDFVFFIGNGVGGTSTCITVTPAGVMTFVAGTESCGTLAGVATLSSASGNPADSGVIRLGSQEFIAWEAATPGTDLTISYNGSDQFAVSAQMLASNLGIDFADSDTNPSCGAGNYLIYADLSETRLKKCMNGVATDLDTGGATVDDLYLAASDFYVDGTNCVINMVALNSFPGIPVITCADNDSGRLVLNITRTSGSWNATTVSYTLTAQSITNQNGLTMVFDAQIVCTASGEQRATAPATGTTNTATITFGNQTNDVRHSNTVAITTSGCAAGEEMWLIIDNEDSGTATQSTTTGVLTGALVTLNRS